MSVILISTSIFVVAFAPLVLAGGYHYISICAKGLQQHLHHLMRKDTIVQLWPHLPWLHIDQTYVLCKPGAIRQVLNNSKQFSVSGRMKSMMGVLLDKGILTDEKSSKQLRKAVKLYLRNVARVDSGIFQEPTETLLARLKTYENDEKVDLEPLFSRLAFSIIRRVLLGRQATNEDLKFEEFYQRYKTVQVELAPWKPRIPFILTKKLHLACTEIRTMVGKLTDPAIESPENSSDLNKIVGPHLKENDTLHIFIAGWDSTACCLCWIFRIIAREAVVLNQLEQCISRMRWSSDKAVHSQEVEESMKYINHVVKEALWLFPPIPLNSRVALNEVRLEGSDRAIPKGSHIVMSSYSLSRQKEYHGNQLGLVEFKPNRWEEKPPPFFSFGLGERMCPGQDFAMKEIRAVVIGVLRHFSVSLPSGEKEDILANTPPGSSFTYSGGSCHVLLSHRAIPLGANGD